MISQAKELLTQNNYSCVIMKEENVIYTSYEKGIRPMLYRLWEDESFIKDTVIADKIIGKAAAILVLYGGVKELYAMLISESALDLLKKHDFSVTYGEIVPYIHNKDKTGMCPMEKAMAEVDDPTLGYELLTTFVKEMDIKLQQLKK